MRCARLLPPILLALTAAACSSQQADYFSAGRQQTAQIEERGLFTGDGPLASRRNAPGYGQPVYAQAQPLPQQPYAAAAHPQPQGRQPYAQQTYAAQPPAAPQQQANLAPGRVVEQRYGPNAYVMQYQPPPQATGGPYAPAPYGYANPRPVLYRPSPVY